MDSSHLPSPTRRSLTYCPLQWMKALWSLGPNVLMIDWWPGYFTHSLLSLIGYFKGYNIILTYNLKLYYLISKGQEEQICGKLTFGWNEKTSPHRTQMVPTLVGLVAPEVELRLGPGRGCGRIQKGSWEPGMPRVLFTAGLRVWLTARWNRCYFV